MCIQCIVDVLYNNLRLYSLKNLSLSMQIHENCLPQSNSDKLLISISFCEKQIQKITCRIAQMEHSIFSQKNNPLLAHAAKTEEIKFIMKEINAIQQRLNSYVLRYLLEAKSELEVLNIIIKRVADARSAIFQYKHYEKEKNLNQNEIATKQLIKQKILRNVGQNEYSQHFFEVLQILRRNFSSNHYLKEFVSQSIKKMQEQILKQQDTNVQQLKVIKTKTKFIQKKSQAQSMISMIQKENRPIFSKSMSKEFAENQIDEQIIEKNSNISKFAIQEEQISKIVKFPILGEEDK